MVARTQKRRVAVLLGDMEAKTVISKGPIVSGLLIAVDNHTVHTNRLEASRKNETATWFHTPVSRALRPRRRKPISRYQWETYALPPPTIKTSVSIVSASSRSVLLGARKALISWGLCTKSSIHVASVQIFQTSPSPLADSWGTSTTRPPHFAAGLAVSNVNSPSIHTSVGEPDATLTLSWFNTNRRPSLQRALPNSTNAGAMCFPSKKVRRCHEKATASRQYACWSRKHAFTWSTSADPTAVARASRAWLTRAAGLSTFDEVEKPAGTVGKGRYTSLARLALGGYSSYCGVTIFGYNGSDMYMLACVPYSV